MDIVANSSKAKKYTLSVFLDLRKCFDIVPHDVLLQKLKFCGILGNAYNWMKDYLSNRTIKVVANGITSKSFVMKTGVPQGSVLSVLLFLLFVNDMHLSTTLEAILFADDSCLNHSSHSLQTLIEETNTELNGVADWFNANKMSLHPKKSKYIIYNAPQAKELSLIHI